MENLSRFLPKDCYLDYVYDDSNPSSPTPFDDLDLDPDNYYIKGARKKLPKGIGSPIHILRARVSERIEIVEFRRNGETVFGPFKARVGTADVFSRLFFQQKLSYVLYVLKKDWNREGVTERMRTPKIKLNTRRNDTKRSK